MARLFVAGRLVSLVASPKSVSGFCVPLLSLLMAVVARCAGKLGCGECDNLGDILLSPIPAKDKTQTVLSNYLVIVLNN